MGSGFNPEGLDGRAAICDYRSWRFLLLSRYFLKKGAFYGLAECS